MLAEYCEKKGLKEKAIEFNIMARKRKEAFTIAQRNNLMEHHAKIMDNYECENEERIKIAQYFESQEKWG